MIPASLSFLAGLLLVQQLPTLPDNRWLIVGALAVAVIVWRRYWLCLCFSTGLLWALLFASLRLTDQLPKSLEGTVIPVQGYITSLPEQHDKGVRFNFNITESSVPLPTTLRLSWYDINHPVKAGQHWSFAVKLKRPHGSLNPGGFDYERWLFTEGIGATGSIRKQPTPVLLDSGLNWNFIPIWRQAISDQLAQALPDTPNLGLIKALTLGDGHGISQAQWEVFRKTGTTHLFVISGSHIGLVAGLVYLLVLKFWARTGRLTWSPQTVAALSALIFGILYSAIAGFTVPTLRAMLMLSMAMSALILQRNTRPLHILATAMLAILVLDPLAVLAPGFWLSFLAVALIIYTISARLKAPKAILQALKINWATWLGISPLLLVFFQQVSLIAPIANAVAVPAIEMLVVPVALVATLLLSLSPTLAQLLFWWVDTVLKGLLWLLVKLADLPLSTLSHTAPSPWALLFAVPAVLLLLAPIGIPGRPLAIILLLPLVFTAKPLAPKPGHVDMTVLDVGQGLAVAVQTASHWLIYDTGPKYSESSDSGQTVLLPFLHSHQVAKLDKVVISHSDSDHIGGAKSLLDNMPVEQILTSAMTELAAYRPDNCQSGQTWQWDGVTFTVLSPDHHFESDNDNSCVLRIDSQQGSVLLTGDVEALGEQALLTHYGPQLKATILLAPHHGSKTSSTQAFIDAVAPDTFIIPAGYLNQFRHPHPEILARYQKTDAAIYNTADTGAITIKTENSKPITTFRDSDGRYWNN